MTPLTTEAAILAYLGREKEATAETIADALDAWPLHVNSLLNYENLADKVLSRCEKPAGVVLYRLSAKGRRLLAKHRAAVAAAYGLEG